MRRREPRPLPKKTTTPEQPGRDTVYHKMRRQLVRGPIESEARRRSEWMVGKAMIQKYLHPMIRFRERTADLDPRDEVLEGVSILSIGSGTGHEMDEMDMLLPGSTIRGLDPNEFFTPHTQRSKEELAHDMDYLPASVRAEDLHGIEDESIDAATILFVLHHAHPDQYPQVFSELRRVLKRPNERGKGGYVFWLKTWSTKSVFLVSAVA